MHQEYITILLIAIVLGLDAFSLSLGIGMGKVSRNYILKFSSTVGVFHIIMPLLGLNLGIIIGKIIGIWAAYLGAIILFYIAIDFFITGYRKTKPDTYKFSERSKIFTDNGSSVGEGWGNILLLGLTVSIDALTVGFSLGTFKVSILITVTIIGLAAAIMTLLGFYGGRIFTRIVGNYAQMFGGITLFLLASKMLFDIVLGGD
jgi:putative Mn2+ efflux pump MntP